MENTLITSDRLNSLVELCKKTKAKTIAEVGVYRGGSLKTLSINFPNAVIFGFDTFEGLPKEKWNKDEIHQPGEFSDTTAKEVYEFIGNPRVVLVKGLFPNTAQGYKDQVFDFVHIDTDFYRSVKESLLWFWPRMSKEGIIVLDDYKWPNCPGVKQALDEFKKPIYESVNYQAYLIKE